MIRPVATLALWLLAGVAVAEAPPIDPALSPGQMGRAVAVEAERRRQGFGDSTVELTMELRGAQGRVRTRRLSWQTLETDDPDAGERSLTLFHEPRDIAGTAFLSHTRLDRADDQWLYLPSLRRVRRIASANRSSAFVGSEFAYEDLLSDEADRFRHRWLRDEPCGDGDCFVIEREPLYEGSGYSRQVVWVDHSEFRPVRIEFHDRRNRLEKTLMLEDYRLYRGRFWRAHRLTMENHLTDSTTVLRFEPFELGSGLAPERFDPALLPRLR